MTNYLLGTVRTTVEPEDATHKHHYLEFVVPLTQEEYAELEQAESTLAQFVHDSQLFIMVEWNLAEFIELNSAYLRAYSQKDHEFFDSRPININLNRIFLNLLASIRSYLDFMQRLLKKRFGEDSDCFRSFKQRCSQEYDQNFSYRFLYTLRNYGQHKGFPITNFSWGQKPSRDDPQKTDFFLEAYIGRDEILRDFEWKKSLEGEVRGLPEYIDVVPHAVTFMESLAKIHLATVNNLFQTLTDAARQVIKYGDRLAGKDGIPVLFEFEGDSKHMQKLVHHPIRLELAREIVKGKINNLIRYTPTSNEPFR